MCLSRNVAAAYQRDSTCVLSRVHVFATPWAAARQAPRSMGFSRQEYWNGLSFPSPGGRPNSEFEPESLASPASAGGFFSTEPLGKTYFGNIQSNKIYY